MRIEITEALWLDEHHEFSLMELAELSGLSGAELQHLIDCEALRPVDDDADATEARFKADCLAVARVASRLRNDFDLDADGLTLTLRLLDRIRELEAQVRALSVQLPQPARRNQPG